MTAQTPDSVAAREWSLRSSLVVLACGIGNVVGVITIFNATFSNFLVPVSRDLGWSRAQFSFVLVLLSLVGVLAYPVAGGLMDRYGARWIGLAGNLLFGAAIALLGLMPSVPIVVYLMFMLLGIVAALPSTVLFARVVSTWFATHRGLVLGLSGGVAFGIGGAIVPAIAQTMIDAWGWRGAYVGLGALSVGLGFPVFLALLKEAPGFDARGGTDRPGVQGLTRRQAFRQPGFWILFGAVSLGAGSVSAIITHAVPIVAETGGSMATALSMLAAIYLLNAVWQLGLGLVLDRSASPRIAGLFVLLGAVGAILIATAHDPAVVIVGGLLIGLSCGTEYGLLPFCIPRYFGFGSYGEIYGSIFGAIMLMQGAMPFAMDLVFDATGSYRPALIGIAFALAGCGAMVCMLPRFGKEPSVNHPVTGARLPAAAE